MTVLRAFIAIDLPDELKETLQQVSHTFQQHLSGLPVRWVPSINMHLSLKFLGDVSETNVETINEIIRTAANSYHAFEISIGGVGVFPNMHRPRVIWVGVEAPEEMISLQRRIETETTRMGYPSEDREYAPHLTLGRVSRNANAAEIKAVSKKLLNEKLGFLGAARVNQIHLFRSQLQPGGPKYTKLFSAALQPVSG